MVQNNLIKIASNNMRNNFTRMDILSKLQQQSVFVLF